MVAMMPTIKAPMHVVDAESGEITETKMVDWHFAMPDTRDGKCPECAVKHDPDDAHNAQSLAYQYLFYSKHNRWPTWADAVAHCPPERRKLWEAALRERGAWTEPTAEEKPQ